jgi:hypothetical protein
MVTWQAKKSLLDIVPNLGYKTTAIIMFSISALIGRVLLTFSCLPLPFNDVSLKQNSTYDSETVLYVQYCNIE